MPKTATVRARLEPGLKHEVEQILDRLGLTASEAIVLLYRQIQLQRALPFTIRIPGTSDARTPHPRRTSRAVPRFARKKKASTD